jgi:hypothetical protein
MPDTWTNHAVTPDEAVACVQSGMRRADLRRTYAETRRVVLPPLADPA